MGENEKLALQLSFNRFLRVGFQGSKLTSNGVAATGAATENRKLVLDEPPTAIGQDGSGV